MFRDLCLKFVNTVITVIFPGDLKSAHRTKVIFASFDIKRTLLIMSPLFLVYIFEH